MIPNFPHGASLPDISSRHPGSGARPRSGVPRASQSALGHGAPGPSLWSEFWQEFCLENQPHERCHIPSDGRQAVDGHWAHFAASLPCGAHVIDLGCGAGIVGRTLLGHRKDLLVTGIDFADVPIPNVENLTIHPWVSMEALPFDDGRFDAAISLFGIEYGDIGKTAGELARTLKRGGRFSFLVHHVESEILCESSTRRRGLRDLLSPRVKAAFLSGNRVGLEQQTKRLCHQYPGEPSVRLFTNLLRRDVVRSRAERQSAWQNLLNGLHTEIALLTQLERSAKSAPEMGNWLVPLLPIMTAVGVSTLRRNSGEPIAWQVNGIR